MVRFEALALRPYQKDALFSWFRLGRRGIVTMPTGAGKTRVAIAAIVACGLPTLVLCPTRALLGTWASELVRHLGEPVGILGDGHHTRERLTVATFESAMLHREALADAFGLLVVDEVHHFASGSRIEALVSCEASARLGLTATGPPPWSEGASRLERVVGPVVYSVTFESLVGRHLADLELVRIPVVLTSDERMAYERLTAPFVELRAAYFRANAAADYGAMIRGVASTAEGRRAMRRHARALDLAYFPSEKRTLVKMLLDRHEGDRSIVFTARAEDAYRIATDNLIPAITSEVSSRERRRVLAKFADGTMRAVVSARVLNEGIDVPDARIAIVVAGTLGEREHVQRIGRVLRPGPGKRAIAYELVTVGTVDERLAKTRGAHDSPPRLADPR